MLPETAGVVGRGAGSMKAAASALPGERGRAGEPRRLAVPR